MRVSARWVLATCLLHACREPGAPSIDSTAAASVDVEAPYTTLEPGESVQLAATVRDLAGRTKPGVAVSWRVSDSTVLTIGTGGLATAGQVTEERSVSVIATHLTVADSVRMTVMPASLPTRRQPIVFIHGLGGSENDWLPVLTRFRRDGWSARELLAATYSSTVSNTATAAVIRNHVDSVRAATRWERVHIVSYSMGSLSSRYYLAQPGGTQHVESWTSISGPNHGTTTANFCSAVPCIEMRPGSVFLTALNAEDETPGSVRYATWWSPCDQLVIPPQSTILSGAQNTETACLPHTGMFTETNYQQVRAFILPQ